MTVERIPLQWGFNQRTISPNSLGVSGIDQQNHNVMFEKMDEGKCTRTRPGFVGYLNTGQVGQGQGLHVFNDATFAVINDTLFSLLGSYTSGATGAAFTTASASAGWRTRAKFDAVNLNDVIYLVGGQDLTASPTAQGDVWMSSDGGVTWGLATGSAPFGARFGHRVVTFNGKMYLLGGWYPTFNVPMNDVWVSSDGVNWTQCTQAAPWAGRAFHCAVATTGGIYVMGGCNTPSLTIGGAFTQYNDVWFSADGVNWTQVTGAAAWTARAGFDCAFYQNQFYLLGGTNPSTLVKNNECWTSTDGRNWTQLTAAALGIGANYGVRLLVYANKMFALGGCIGVDQGQTTVYSSINGSAWTLVGSPLTGGRGEGAAIVAYANSAQSPNSVYTMMYMGGLNAVSASLGSTINATLNVTFASFPLSPDVTGQAYEFAEFNNGGSLLIKNQSNMWVFQHGIVTKVTDTRYPKITVPGIVTLGGFAYVMDPTGLIVNCDFNNPLYWPGQNYIGADYEPDGGVAIAKYLNYLVAFGTQSIQFMYDAGIAIGSPLLPYQAGNQMFACLDPLSVQTVGGNLYWYGCDSQKYSGIATFNGLKAQIISPEPINRMLNTLALFNIPPFQNFQQAMAVATQTHSFYIYPLNANAINPFVFPTPGSLVYHINENEWYLWQAGQDFDLYGSSGVSYQCSAFTPGLNTGGTLTTRMLSLDGSFIAYPSDIEPTDTDNSSFTPTSILQPFVITGQIDFGNRRMKAWGRVDMVGDQAQATCNVLLAVSDDDYKTWNISAVFDMTSVRPAAWRQAASRRRAWRIQINNDPNGAPIRLKCLEQEFEQGT